MKIRRITISVPLDIARRVKKAAGGESVSAWVSGVIEERLDDHELERLWRDFYRSVQPRAADVRRANAMLKRLGRPGRKAAA